MSAAEAQRRLAQFVANAFEDKPVPAWKHACQQIPGSGAVGSGGGTLATIFLLCLLVKTPSKNFQSVYAGISAAAGYK